MFKQLCVLLLAGVAATSASADKYGFATHTFIGVNNSANVTSLSLISDTGSTSYRFAGLKRNAAPVSSTNPLYTIDLKPNEAAGTNLLSPSLQGPYFALPAGSGACSIAINYLRPPLVGYTLTCNNTVNPTIQDSSGNSLHVPYYETTAVQNGKTLSIDPIIYFDHHPSLYAGLLDACLKVENSMTQACANPTTTSAAIKSEWVINGADNANQLYTVKARSLPFVIEVDQDAFSTELSSYPVNSDPGIHMCFGNC